MNFYIDFDNTLYETAQLISDMLSCLAEEICKHSDSNINEVSLKLKNMFNRENIYNIYKLAKYFANEYNIEDSILINKVEKVILNGKKYVFDDSIEFLESLKSKGHIINLLTYVEKGDMSYQLSKIKGSGLSEYFDNIIMCSSPKYDLNLKYEEGIFIDDKPRELIGLSQKNPKQLIRLRRKQNKYSKQNLEINKVQEYETFKELKFE